MDRPRSLSPELKGRFPCACGDGPTRHKRTSTEFQFSLRVRGWTELIVHLGAVELVFPARAGMDRIRNSGVSQNRGFPCACGDGPATGLKDIVIGSFSLRVRGWTKDTVCWMCLDLVFPARAGMDRNRGRAASTTLVFPARAGMDRLTTFCAHAERSFPCACGDGPQPVMRRLQNLRFPCACGDGPRAS